MNTATQFIIEDLKSTMYGQPWFGRAFFEILDEIDESKAFIHPTTNSHSLVELLYHTITWTVYCLHHLQHAALDKIKEIENNDWRSLNMQALTWKRGVEELQKNHQQIIAILETKNDDFLLEKVTDKNFDFRTLLIGLIHHNIYHLGQIAYTKKLLDQ